MLGEFGGDLGDLGVLLRESFLDDAREALAEDL